MPGRGSLPQMVPWLAFAAAPGLAFLLLRTNGSLDFEANSAEGHFYIVSVVALMNVVLGLAASVAALRGSSVRVLLLALSFVSMAGIFAIHGLSTPGFLVGDEYNEVTGLSSRLSTLVAAVLLAASAMEFPQPLERAVLRFRLPILAIWILGLIGYGAATLSFPQAIPNALVMSPLMLYGTLFAVVALALFAAQRYFDGFRRSGLPMYGAVALGSVLLVQAQLGMHFGVKYHGTWWLYHVMLFIGFSAILWGLFIEYARGRSPVNAIEGLTLHDPIDQIRAGYTESIRSLAAALEAKDGYTLGHGERVASLSVLMGEELGFSPERLRTLYQGAMLHDVGKIGVPDRILHKPGRLTDEEFEIVKHHPTRGEGMLASAVGSGPELAVILHHHERYDGQGYPLGLKGKEIPLEARIAAVADVYDALRSARAYRPAWTQEEAAEHIASSVGSHFDPECVEAFQKVAARWEAKYADDGAPYLAYRPAA